MPENIRKTKEYMAWKYMKSRCYAPSRKDIGNYQKNNIEVCDEWKNSFESFYKDMGPKPSDSYSLDRIDNNKGYYKENCRWADSQIQNNNKENNIVIVYENQTKTLKEWAIYFNINYTTLYQRIYRQKLDFQSAILFVSKKQLIAEKTVEIKELLNKGLSVNKIAKMLKISNNSITKIKNK